MKFAFASAMLQSPVSAMYEKKTVKEKGYWPTNNFLG